MPFQRVPYTAEAALIFTYQGKIMQNRMNFEIITPPYDATYLGNLATAVDLWCETDYQPLISSDWSYLRTEVRGLDSEFDLVVVDDTSAGAGESVNSAYPANVCKAFTLRSGLTGRSARGRWFSMGLSAAFTLNTNRNTITTTYRDSMIAALEALIADAFVAGWVAVITSRYHDGEKRDEGLNFAIAEVGVSDLTTDSQRNRLPT